MFSGVRVPMRRRHGRRRECGGACVRHELRLVLLAGKDEINMIFAAAPSQNDVLKSLVESVDIPWNRINACRMDEYIGLDGNAPQGFGNFLKAHIFGLVPFKSVNLIDSAATEPEAESERYTEVLKKSPADIVVMGIGENGHIAFDDPTVADFNDPKWMKPVKLDDICRQQQVNDGCFAKFDSDNSVLYLAPANAAKL